MRVDLAVETTTLPEGAILKLARVKDVTSTRESAPRTILSAKNDRATIEMTVAHVAPHNLRDWLQLAVKEIEKRREKIDPDNIPNPTEKTPSSFKEFTEQMAAYSMFLLR